MDSTITPYAKAEHVLAIMGRKEHLAAGLKPTQFAVINYVRQQQARVRGHAVPCVEDFVGASLSLWYCRMT